MPILGLDSLEFRSPLVEFPKKDGTFIGLLISAVWQRRLRSLWEYVQNPNRIINVTEDRSITTADLRAMLVCVGALTLTLPVLSRPGDRYFVYNYGADTVTVAGTINDNPAGYQFTAQYKYAEFTSLDGLIWIITNQKP